MIIKTNEGQQYCEKLKKVLHFNQDKTKPLSILKIASDTSPSHQPSSPKPSALQKEQQQLESNSNGSNKVKRIVISTKEYYNVKSDTTLQEICQQQRSTLVKQFPMPYSQQVPKRVEFTQIADFLKPRNSSLPHQTKNKNINQLLLPTTISSPTQRSPQETQENIQKPNYVNQMINRQTERLIRDFSYQKKQQSLLDKLTPRQYALLTRQGEAGETDSPQLTQRFYKYAVLNQNQNPNELEPFTRVHYNSKETERDEKKTSYFNEIVNSDSKISQNSSKIINASPQIVKVKTLPSFNMQQQINQRKGNENSSQSLEPNRIMITEVDRSYIHLEANYSFANSNPLIQNELQSEDRTLSKLFNQSCSPNQTRQKHIEPRFLTFQKQLQEYQQEEKKAEKEQLNLQTPDRLNIGFVNALIRNAKHIERVQGMYYQRKEVLDKLGQQIKERVEERIEKRGEVFQPPIKEQTEFESYIKEYDKLKSESKERKQHRINELPINKQRKIIWKKLNLEETSKSKSPPRIIQKKEETFKF